MELLESLKEIEDFCIKNKTKIIGLVPTMGFLHEGHMSLVKKAREDCDIVIVSIYVNPTQFGPNEDLDSYPRDLEHDKLLCANAGVDAIFSPSNETMYKDGYETYVEVKKLTKKLCGKTRPTHFRGVTTIVSKLFNIIKPHKAYFGKKDYQQVLVVKKMVNDLNMTTEIIPCPIVRENDGLAMSSRNKYLTKEEHIDALILNRTLNEAKKMFLNGEKNPDTIKLFIKNKINNTKTSEIDYVEIYDKNNLTDINIIEKNKTLIALAVKFGKARLLDNIEL